MAYGVAPDHKIHLWSFSLTPWHLTKSVLSIVSLMMDKTRLY